MGKVFGILFVAGMVWVGAEVMTQGVDGAFGGVFAAEGSEHAPEGEAWAGDRAGSTVGAAHDEAEERRRRMMGE